MNRYRYFIFLLLAMALTSCQATKFEHIHTSHSIGSAKKIIAPTYWNDTGITLQKGHRYQLHVSGTWTDWTYEANAKGPVSPLVNALMFPLRPLLRYSPFRDCHANYFQPIGTIGRGEGKKLPVHSFIIENGMHYTAPATGILHVFANDAPWEWTYGNNSGQLDLTVTSL